MVLQKSYKKAIAKKKQKLLMLITISKGQKFPKLFFPRHKH